MGKKIVVLGDATSHGGKVVSVSSTFEIEGKNVALLNDSVSCPEHGSNPIVECDMSYEENGRGIVAHGCKSACGSVIFASLPDVDIG
ncbi:PAAR domain-containing protein [Klebsiella michiganensis]|uniref:PAAR domain-containing protein n=1 Tax=Klebsiella michiganensis TaxID=1134687 RepID=UPI000FF8FA47|nr:PAAR domain-containing protein [Klebsiella michiganensis]MCW9616845.1 PAAR domain-containing protein [Klebsiella michiganensis]MDH1760144.1 PAAR domain-containing protein [Klebsiella michiganensis]MDV5293565.1 PAAR domain-containing protein [Klebsiella michiganensis]MDV5345830.1 PAAR domain-containing protein [Klebsiella michiganensis]MDV5446287.1 PAAR domain-containing protein [Klebsiella michiganensis]